MKKHENLRNCFNCENWAEVMKFMNAETKQEIFLCEACLKKALSIFKPKRLKLNTKVYIVQPGKLWPNGVITQSTFYHNSNEIKYHVWFESINEGHDFPAEQVKPLNP